MFLDKIKFNSNGLIPVIAQDYKSHKVLMLAFMNLEALKLSIDNGRVVYYSRTRQKLWYKGELSGNIQLIKEILTDCDYDTILIKIQQINNIACHTGRNSCFFNKLVNDNWELTEKIIKSPQDIYG